jgi:hypothetical protein
VVGPLERPHHEFVVRQQLERDAPVEAQLGRLVHHRVASAAELALQPEALDLDDLS